MFTGAFAINPVNDARDPDLRRRLRAHGLRHRRDHGGPRARPARLRVRRGVRALDRRVRDPAAAGMVRRARDRRRHPGARLAGGVRRRRRRRELGECRRLARRARRRRRRRPAITDVARGRRSSATATVNYKLRDWLFSRQRYWGEPFPIVYDEPDLPVAVPESMLPVELPEIIDFEPEIVADDVESVPAPPLSRAEAWVHRGAGPRGRLGRRQAKTYRRELNTMPQWAGSCWYYLRYLDPTNEDAFVERRGRAVLDGSPGPVAWTSTSVASSTRCCTCCTRASGTRCCSTSATCRRPSRSSACSTRATSRRPRSPTSAGSTSRRARSSSSDGAFTPRRRRRCSASTGRWARA